MIARIVRSLSRPDVRANPPRAVARRVRWKLRWLVCRHPWRLRLPNGLPIDVPRGGAGALIYYLGFSEPLIAEFVSSFLRPDMVVIDAGAHIGEYALLAASIVGERGQVHAFEPVEELAVLLRGNVRLNGFGNVEVHPDAVADESGMRDFEIFEERALCSLDPGVRENSGRGDSIGRIRVRTIMLDDFQQRICRHIDLIKVDVEGAELLVLHGAARLLSLPPDEAPVWILEHSRENYARFGYGSSELLQLMSNHGYTCMEFLGAGKVRPVTVGSVPPGGSNLVATKSSIEGIQKWLKSS